ncbi:MAG: hypothetical protein KAS70_07805 [Planctomycetes bacterium]|nr:hypothetical protein [Planctomycetota bacterium]
MKQMISSKLILTVGALSALFFTAGCMMPPQGASGGLFGPSPFLKGARQAEPEPVEPVQKLSLDQDADGKTDAENDIKNKPYKYYVISQPAAHDSIWRTDLEDYYGIRMITLGCRTDSREGRYVMAYNEVMIPFLKEKFGENFLSISEEKAKEKLNIRRLDRMRGYRR